MSCAIHSTISTEFESKDVFISALLLRIHYVFYVHNFWAYPILGQLSFVGRIALIGVACLVFYSAYLFGDFLTYMVHSGTGNNGSGGVPAVATTSKAHKKYRGYGKRSKN